MKFSRKPFNIILKYYKVNYIKRQKPVKTAFILNELYNFDKILQIVPPKVFTISATGDKLCNKSSTGKNQYERRNPRMVVLIFGASHSGKTLLAQKILEKYGFPYLSIDHLKMGLIRSGNTDLTPEDDEKLMEYLWPIVREMIKTAVENNQNLTVEGCYIPFDWKKDFDAKYLENIRECCLVMTEDYIRRNSGSIIEKADVIEKRLFDSVEIEELIAENKKNLALCRENKTSCLIIDNEYKVEFEL